MASSIPVTPCGTASAAMSDERVTSFFEKMVRAGVVKSDIDYRKSYTLRFVNKAVGVELRPGK